MAWQTSSRFGVQFSLPTTAAACYFPGGAFGTRGWVDPHKDLFAILLIQRAGLKNADASPMR